MAYRFNPPPNWPIDDAEWSPPPGWQPDPSWGPAPEGWNFWIAEDAAPAAPAPVDDDATHVASTDDRAPEEPADAAASAPAEQPAAEASSAPADQYGAMNPYGSAPQPAAAEEPHGRHAAAPAGAEPEQPVTPEEQGPVEPADDPTHVAGSGSHVAPPEDAAQRGSAPDTAEYEGPDLEAGLAQQTPYETDAPRDAAPGEQTGAESAPGHGAAAVAGGAAAAGAAGAFAAQGTTGPAGQDPAEAPAAPTYGQPSPDQGYGQGSPAGYGQASPSQGYGQGSPAGYGQASPNQGYGQGSAADHPAQGYGQPSPGTDPGTAWTASTGAGEPPKKGVIQRFWWVGCLFLLLLALILIAAGGIWLFTRDGGGQEAGGGGGGATTSAQQSSDEETTDEETVEEDPTEEETTEEIPTPTDLSTIDPAAEKEAVEIVSNDGTGTIAVHMEYLPASELESSYGGTVEEPQHGDEYLVVTAKMTVTEGQQYFSPGTFSVVTPYGGEVDASVETYGLKGSGTGGPSDFSAGDEYTLKMLFDVQRAGDLKLNFTTFADDYTWDVPA